MRPLFLLLACCLSLPVLAWQNPASAAGATSPANPAGQADTTKRTIPVVEVTIATIHRALQKRTCTCEGLVNEYLRRITAYDKPTGLNSIVLTNPEALSVARGLDAEYARTHQLRPLHCIPLIVKDNYNTRGLQTTGGSLALKGYAPAADATLVRRLRDAGAIVLAKSNMAEWAFSPMVTISSIAGETRNPYNLDFVPAGSSGGTAAAVAANLGEAGLGTDTGNSIRGPSSHNALVGFRCTIGLLSRDGIIPLFLRNDMGGPMARTVEDATRLLEVMAGYDPADPITRYSSGKIPVNYTQYLDKHGLRGARIGVFRTLSERNPDPQVKALFEKALTAMRHAGAIIVDNVTVENFDSLAAHQWCETFQQDIDYYLSTLDPAPPVRNLREIIASGKYSAYIRDDLNEELAKGMHTDTLSHTCGDAYTDPRRIAFRNAVVAAMDKYKVAAIVYPTWNNRPALIGDFKGYKGDNSQIIAPHTGQPAFTIPMGFTDGHLPAGIQFLGRPFDEPTLIRVCYSFEQATFDRRPPANFPELASK